MSQTEIKEILNKYKVIAVVGLSSNEDKPSYEVSAYMKNQGYHIIPVNPNVDEVLGEKCYKSLLDIPTDKQKTIEIVNIFRSSADVSPIIDQAVKLKEKYGNPYVVWMQVGIVNKEAEEAATKGGLVVVMDKCIMIEHNRLRQS